MESPLRVSLVRPSSGRGCSRGSGGSREDRSEGTLGFYAGWGKSGQVGSRSLRDSSDGVSEKEEAEGGTTDEEEDMDWPEDAEIDGEEGDDDVDEEDGDEDEEEGDEDEEEAEERDGDEVSVADSEDCCLGGIEYKGAGKLRPVCGVETVPTLCYQSNRRSLRCIFDSLGFKQTAGAMPECVINWCILRNIGNKTLRSLHPCQRIGAIKGLNALNNKFELYRQVREMHRAHPEAFNFMPRTFMAKREWAQFEKYAKTRSGSMWIIKPLEGAMGMGISVCKGISETKVQLGLRKKWRHRALISEYLGNPMLINGHKFDLRVYVLVVSMEPLRVYVYREGLVRVATQEYSTNNTAKMAHLTNYSLNKVNSDFVAAKGIDDTTGYKQSFTALEQHLKEMGHNTDKAWNDIHDVCLKTIIAAHHHCTPHESCFQLLGFDVMLDAHMKPWVIEVNAGLSLSYDTSNLDAEIKGNALIDILNIIGVSKTPPPQGDPDPRKSTTDPLLAVKEEFRRHASLGSNGWSRVFPTERSSNDHLHLFKRPGLLTTALVQKLRGNPRYGLGADSAPPPGYFVFDNIVGSQLRRQFKDWKKTRKKKKSGTKSTYSVGKSKRRARTGRTMDSVVVPEPNLKRPVTP